ncbi:MAG: carboxypeptidase regulatory-like domain-containing protein, partial [Acidobacteriaceae bacterium]|nr:carboxypeptidase regulatory-like domain-containing protein [Acidobacteriaceae bacterium]
MKIAVCVAVLLCAAGSVFAQSQLATVSGTITDPSGSAVPGAKVHLVNTETGESWHAETEAAGTYFIPLVKPGTYTLTVDANGFKKSTREGVHLETGDEAGIDMRLDLGSVNETVSVTAEAPLLKSETSAVAAVVENRTIVNMPLIDRRAAQLAKLNGFVVQGAGSATDFSIAGGRSDNAMWIIDGGNAQNVTLGNPQLEFDPPVEALQEFNVSISNYAAELGRTGGGVIQMTTKSGTNQFHGSLYEYFRNDDLDARSFFAASKPILRYNLFGASLGGPIRKDKTHFFFNYEGRRQTSASAVLVNLPTPQETRGDFSDLSTPIRDATTPGRPVVAHNVIPTPKLDPLGLKLAAFYPAPNVAGRPSGSSNYAANQVSINPSNTYVARIDQVFGDKDRAYGRALINTGSGNKLPYFPT